MFIAKNSRFKLEAIGWNIEGGGVSFGVPAVWRKRRCLGVNACSRARPNNTFFLHCHCVSFPFLPVVLLGLRRVIGIGHCVHPLLNLRTCQLLQHRAYVAGVNRLPVLRLVSRAICNLNTNAPEEANILACSLRPQTVLQ